MSIQNLNLKINDKEFNCQECNDKGYLTDKHGNFLKYCNCEVKKHNKEILINNLNKSGLRDVVKRYTFDNYIINHDWQRDYKNRIISFANDHSRAFIMLGQTGLGKTHLMSALTIELMRKGKNAHYVKWQDIIISAKNNYGNIDPKLLEIIRNVEVLYIDDFLKVKSIKDISNIEYEIANLIIDTRESDKDLITLLSSELSLEQLGAFNGALTGRLIEMCGGVNSKNIINSDYKENGNYRLK